MSLLVPVLAWAVDWAHERLDSAFDPRSLVVSAAVFATLYLRDRRPGLVLVVQLIWSVGAEPLMGVVSPLTGSLVALQALAARRPPALSVGGLAATTTVLFIQVGFPASDSWAEGLTGFLIATTAWALGYRRYDTVTVQQEVTRDALRAERLRLARDLHDIVTHAISAIVMQAAGARAVIADDPERAAQALDAIETTGVQAMDELRRLLGLLRSAGGDVTPDLNRQPGLQDIGGLLDWARTNGLIPATSVEGEPGLLDEFTSLAAYRLVQEALTNTLKHAGPGAVVELVLRWGDENLDIRIQDRPPARRERGRLRLNGGHGLLGLHERITVVGGTLNTYPSDGGFVVEARLPLKRRRTASSTTPPIRERTSS
ncbi:sensor histidine kinase [Actinoplanes subglobosus]|uniref:histidine kinase n=1 Tax=Actinoplanes subglobosus TaxID=1547892 RepID=A0ABV8JBC2_9ACTN